MSSAKSATSARILPVQALKQQVVALDAAMLVAVTAAEEGAVHKLRTGTRRVEAAMLLLEIAAEAGLRLPPHADEAKVVRHRLRKVRQAAGEVRDLDVQRAAIWYDAPAKTAVHKGTPGHRTRKEAKQLRKHLESRREQEAAELVKVLKAEEEHVAAALRALERAVKPARAGVSQAAFLAQVQSWFRQQTLAQIIGHGRRSKDALRQAIESLDEDALHTVRKAAKLCRYMAEAAPEGTAAAELAAQFEALQEAGGTWHDWLLLHRLSAKFHGGKALLTERYAHHCEAALADYRLKLAELLPALAAGAAPRGSRRAKR